MATHVMRTCSRRIVTVAVLSLTALLRSDLRAAPPEVAQAAPAPAPAGAPAGAPAPAPAVSAPADPNDLSLGITALERIYDLDLSAAQLTSLRTLANGTADNRQRTPAKSTPKLVSSMRDLYAALAAWDGERINTVREQVLDAEDDEAVELDDDVRATDAARARAPEAMKMLRAGQVAAYLAEHADEVADPAEILTETLAEVRQPDFDDPDGEVRFTAEEVGRLVAGLDAAKAQQVARQAEDWLKAGRQLKDNEYTAQQAALADSARKLTGDLPAMTVITHWMENEVADLLANPQLPAAIDAASAGKK